MPAACSAGHARRGCAGADVPPGGCGAPRRRSDLLERSLAQFARGGSLMDVENKYKRFDLYNPVVQCPPGRELKQYGGWLDPNVSRQPLAAAPLLGPPAPDLPGSAPAA
jgi:hypothetical protein